jgi:putative membrane protein
MSSDSSGERLTEQGKNLRRQFPEHSSNFMELSALPTIDALLNATSAAFLTLGYIFIRRKKVTAHKACMLGAVATSTLFLVCYLTYHYFHGTTHFAGQGAVRWVYFSILGSHTILAALIVPLVLVTLYRAFRERFEKHKRIARWTLPIWLYVSVTGVVVYWMLYHLF